MTGVVVGFAYVLIVGKLFGRGQEGFGLVGALFSFPMLGFVTGLCWLLLDWLLARRAGPLPPARAAVFGALLGLVIGLVFAGPRGFTLRPGAELFNYFLIALAATGAWLHRLLARA